MVLSPQCFHNLNLHEDIFNHSNIHFWEYMQPGYDALGFISCTGTVNNSEHNSESAEGAFPLAQECLEQRWLEALHCFCMHSAGPRNLIRTNVYDGAVHDGDDGMKLLFGGLPADHSLSLRL